MEITNSTLNTHLPLLLINTSLTFHFVFYPSDYYHNTMFHLYETTSGGILIPVLNFKDFGEVFNPESPVE